MVNFGSKVTNKHVIARSAATKQSNWIATARFAHLAMAKKVTLLGDS
jgi:hypothetical protein